MRLKAYRVLPALLGGLALLAGLPGPAGRAAAAPRAGPALAAALPVLTIVPDYAGTDLSIAAGQIGRPSDRLFANFGTGPTGNKGGYTLPYSDTLDSYVTTVSGFAAQADFADTISITSTEGLNAPPVGFTRGLARAGQPATITLVDGSVQLQVLSPGTFSVDTYVVLAPSYAPPGPPPLGYRIVGSAYGVRASGAQPSAGKAMLLDMAYSANSLAGADPYTLAAFFWNPNLGVWQPLESALDTDNQLVSVVTERFGFYALMATSTWADSFDDIGGLDLAQIDNITILPLGEGQALTLANSPGAGTAVSRPIAPPGSFVAWGQLRFEPQTPAGTTLSVDVLSASGQQLLAGAANGASLAAIDRQLHPSLRLRANLASGQAGARPALDRWQITWRMPLYRVFLPAAAR